MNLNKIFVFEDEDSELRWDLAWAAAHQIDRAEIADALRRATRREVVKSARDFFQSVYHSLLGQQPPHRHLPEQVGDSR